MITKLKNACRKLGITVKEMGEFLEVEYNYFSMLISPDRKRKAFFIFAYALDAHGNMDEQQFNLGLDVAKDFHKDYWGDWNDGNPYFASFEYRVSQGKDIDPSWLKEKLDDFWEAYTFLLTNLFILGDETFFRASNSGRT